MGEQLRLAYRSVPQNISATMNRISEHLAAFRPEPMRGLIVPARLDRLEHREEFRRSNLGDRAGAKLLKRKLLKPLLPFDERLLRHPIALHIEVLARERFERILHSRLRSLPLRTRINPFSNESPSFETPLAPGKTCRARRVYGSGKRM